MIFLMKLIPGEYYVIRRVLNPLERTSYRRQLFAMGLVPGTRVEVKRIAPLGDPIQLKVGDFSLSLRRQDLQDFLELEPVTV